MTSAGAIKFYANHLYPGRCPLRSSRFSTPTFRSVNHFSHPFFSETKTQKTSRNFQRIRVNPHSSHVYISRSLFFSFLHSTPHTLWQDKKMEEGNEKVDPRVRSRENYRRRRQETGSILAMDSSLTNDWNVNWPTISLFHLIIWIHSRVDPLK